MPGYVDDVHGYAFNGLCVSAASAAQSDPQVSWAGRDPACVKCTAGGSLQDMDPDSHGTHVSGIIAAVQNNSLGVTGAAPEVKIMVLKVSAVHHDHTFVHPWG